jgi:hypothetical protein
VRWHRPPVEEPVTIGVVGPRDLVQRILLMPSQPDSQPWRLVGAAHARESQTYEQVMKIADRVDAILFTGPFQYDLARESGELPVPATYVPVSGASLYSGIIRGLMGGTLDPSRVSIDSISAADVEAAYADIKVSTQSVHTIEYRGAESVEKFVDFHRSLYQSGATTAALTTVKSVAQRLVAAKVEAFRLVPPAHSIWSALTNAALLGAGSILGEAQIVIVVVQVSPALRPVSSGPQNYRQTELILSLHRLLLSEVADLGVALLQRDVETFVITATRSSLTQLITRLRASAFVDRMRAETGMAVDIGVGVGETPQAAEERAYTALRLSREDGGTEVYLARPDGSSVTLSAPPDGAAPTERPAASSKALETLRRILEVLPERSDGPVVVDAETVAERLAVTPRSARRMLALLVEAGMAWPMPAAQVSRSGRPRQTFRLVS